MQSVYYKMKDIKYYPQILIEQWGYRPFSNNVLFHPDLIFADTESESEPDSEAEEIDENTVLDE